MAGVAAWPTGYGDSPYQSLSSFAGNGLLISPDWLIEEGLLEESECAPPLFPPAAVDYAAVITFKRRLLEKGLGQFPDRPPSGAARCI